jgi:hypothetical protein
MIYVLDDMEVEPANVHAYLEAFETLCRPVAEENGQEFVGCLTTPRAIGEPVRVTSVYRVPDWSRWNEIRQAVILDPRSAAWWEARQRLCVRGQRRFAEATPSSPLL